MFLNFRSFCFVFVLALFVGSIRYRWFANRAFFRTPTILMLYCVCHLSQEAFDIAAKYRNYPINKKKKLFAEIERQLSDMNYQVQHLIDDKRLAIVGDACIRASQTEYSAICTLPRKLEPL